MGYNIRNDVVVAGVVDDVVDPRKSLSSVLCGEIWPLALGSLGNGASHCDGDARHDL